MVQELWDNQQPFHLISASYFGFNKKRNIYLNWKEQEGKHAINLLARISQNAPVKCTLTIDVFHLRMIKDSSWADNMEQDVVVSEHEPLVVINEPATSIMPIVKYVSFR